MIIQTRDGRLIVGLPVAKTDFGITLVNQKNERVHLAMADIEDIRDGSVSLMPEDIHRQISPVELRDLFAYLESKKGG